VEPASQGRRWQGATTKEWQRHFEEWRRRARRHLAGETAQTLVDAVLGVVRGL
jgi:hypothetical protein